MTIDGVRSRLASEDSLTPINYRELRTDTFTSISGNAAPRSSDAATGYIVLSDEYEHG